MLIAHAMMQRLGRANRHMFLHYANPRCPRDSWHGALIYEHAHPSSRPARVPPFFNLKPAGPMVLCYPEMSCNPVRHTHSPIATRHPRLSCRCTPGTWTHTGLSAREARTGPTCGWADRTAEIGDRDPRRAAAWAGSLLVDARRAFQLTCGSLGNSFFPFV